MGEKRSKAGANRRSHKKRAQPMTPEAIAYAKAQRQGATFTQAVTAGIAADGEATPAQWGINQDLAGLATSKAVAIRTDAAKRRITNATRQDVFGALKSTGTLTFHEAKAVERLAEDLARRAGTGGTGNDPAERDRVDCAPQSDPLAGMLEAGKRVDAVLILSGEPNARLVLALLDGRLPDTHKVDPVEEARLACALRDWHIQERLRKALPAHERPDAAPFPHRRSRVPWRQIVAAMTGITNPDAQSVPVVIGARSIMAAYIQWDKGVRPPERIRIDAG